jgi:hypothetical protein
MHKDLPESDGFPADFLTVYKLFAFVEVS